MKTTLEVGKSLFKSLSGDACKILMYYTAYYQKNGEVPSMTKVSKTLNMGYINIRKRVVEIYHFLFIEKLPMPISPYLKSKDLSSSTTHTSIYSNYYSFMRSKISKVYDNYMERQRTYKPSYEEALWSTIVEKARKYYEPKFINSSFYWKVKIYLNKLLEKIGYEYIDDYTDWWFKKISGRVKHFNYGIFSTYDIIVQYMADKGTSRNKEKHFIEHEQQLRLESIREQKTILKNLLKRKKEGIMDEYDKELLEHYRKIGWLNE